MTEENSRPSGSGTGILALTGLIREVQDLGERLAAVSAALLEPEGVTPAQRGLLVALRTAGPCTVAQLARSLDVSRQHARMLAGPLAAAGWVDTRDNPEHKSARLLTLTPAGQTGLKRILAREGQVVTRLAAALPADQVGIARAVLQDLRAGLGG